MVLRLAQFVANRVPGLNSVDRLMACHKGYFLAAVIEPHPRSTRSVRPSKNEGVSADSSRVSHSSPYGLPLRASGFGLRRK